VYLEVTVKLIKNVKKKADVNKIHDSFFYTHLFLLPITV